MRRNFDITHTSVSRRATVSLQHVRQDLLAFHHSKSPREDALSEVRAEVSLAESGRQQGRRTTIVKPFGLQSYPIYQPSNQLGHHQQEYKKFNNKFYEKQYFLNENGKFKKKLHKLIASHVTHSI